MGVFIEHGVLSATLIDPAALSEVILGLRDFDFDDGPSRECFRALSDLWEDGYREVDGQLISDRMEDDDFVWRLVDALVDLQHVPQYVREMRLQACERRLGEAFSAFAGDSSEEATGQVAKLLMERDEAQNALRGLDQEQRSVREMLQHFEDGDRIPTGLTDLDRHLDGGLEVGSLTVVAGNTGHGKTSLATQAVISACRQGLRVSFFTVEMMPKALWARILSASSGIRLHIVREARSPVLDDSLFQNAVDEADRWQLDFHSGSVSLATVATCLVKDKPNLVVVDYLQIMTPGAGENRTQQVSALARGLKQMTTDHEVPILLLSQLNRSASSEKRHPRLSDLKESGEIEQAADVVIFVHREDDNEEMHGMALAIVAKNRNGPTGNIMLSWDGACTRFGNLAKGGHT